MRKTSVRALQIIIYIYIGVIVAPGLQSQELRYGSEEFFVEIHGFFAHEYFDFQQNGKANGVPSFDNHYLFLFVNPQVRENLWLETELEYEHGGQIIELDRAVLFWQPAKFGTVYMGKFYAPFGIERKYWYPSLNSLVARTMPSRNITLANWYTIGAGVRGSIPLWLNATLNYDVAIANGVTSPHRSALHPDDPSDAPTRDNNSDKASVGRIGFSPLQGLEFGASFYTGKYDKGERYRVSLLGGDVDWVFNRLSLRGEYIWSPVETMDGDYSRSGLYLQAAYQLLKETEYLNYLELAARYDTLDLNSAVTDDKDLNRLTLGLNISPYPHLLFKINYEIITERAAPKLANNGIWIQSVFDF